MTSTNNAPAKTTRSAIKDLMQARVQLAEKLATQLEKWTQVKAERQAIDERIAAEAATARQLWDDCLASGWTAKELASAGLKPPSPPRTRSSGPAASLD